MEVKHTNDTRRKSKEAGKGGKLKETGRLQDIDLWIKMVESEKKRGFLGLVTKITNRLAVPFMMFKSTDEWLKILKQDRKHELERIQE